MGWPAVIAAVAPIVLDWVLSDDDPSGAFSNQSIITNAEAARVQEQLTMIRRLEALSGQGSAMPGILAATGGQGFQLPRTLEEARAGGPTDLADIFGAIDFNAVNEQQQLLSLLGSFNPTTAASQQSAILADRNRREQEQTFGEIAQLLGGLFGGSGGKTGRETAAASQVPVNFGDTVSSSLPTFTID